MSSATRVNLPGTIVWIAPLITHSPLVSVFIRLLDVLGLLAGLLYSIVFQCSVHVCLTTIIHVFSGSKRGYKGDVAPYSLLLITVIDLYGFVSCENVYKCFFFLIFNALHSLCQPLRLKREVSLRLSSPSSANT